MWCWCVVPGIPPTLSLLRLSALDEARSTFVYFQDPTPTPRLTGTATRILVTTICSRATFHTEDINSRIPINTQSCTKWLRRDPRSASPPSQPALSMYKAFLLLLNSFLRRHAVPQELPRQEVRSRNQQWVSRWVRSRH